MMNKIIGVFLCVFFIATLLPARQVEKADICIYGATSAGVIAAYTASKAGKSVIMIDPGKRLGGLSSGGLGMTDIGNKYVVTGLALDFYRKLGKHYGALEQWIFEPKVAEQIFKDYMTHTDVVMLMDRRLTQVDKDGTTIRRATFLPTSGEKGETAVEAKIFIDCTYEGDLFALAGASYHVGREDNKTYGETLNGVQLLKGHQFTDGIDPYVVKGNPESGLIWGVNADPVKPQGTGDHKVQAYNYRITLTNVPENRLPITQPDNYDPARYELLKRQREIQPWKSLSDAFIWSIMPNGKTDINNRNGLSTDMIGMNWDYPEANYARRQEIIKAHEDYTKGLLYFVGNDPSVPEFIRSEMQSWGYPKDEYVDYGHWSPQLYIREARRLIGELVMTQHHCQGREVVDDVVGYAAYTMDSHNCDRIIVDGMVKNEGNVEVGGFLPFAISYRALLPQRKEVTNLLVPVSLSASHIAFGSIRMEPVFMVLAQSAAVAACLAIDLKQEVQNVDVKKIQAILKENPKADFRDADMLVHVSNESQVTLTGNWQKGDGKGFGMSYMQVGGEERGVAKAVFRIPAVKVSQRYKLYTYFPKTANSANGYTLSVSTAAGKQQSFVDLAQVEIKGQTSSTWVPVGEVTLSTMDKDAYIEINNEGSNGIVAANAILLVPADDQLN